METSSKESQVLQLSNPSIEKWAKSIQALATLSFTFYITGYFSWTIFAMNNDLGIIPTFREQYFMAGVIPVLLTLLLLYILIFHYRFSGKLNEKISNRRSLNISLTVLGFILSFAAVGVIGYQLIYLHATKPWQSFLCGVILYLGAYLVTITTPNSDYKRGFQKWQWIFNFIGLWWVFFCGYTEILFPIIPQEFGGPKPICVELDIKKDELSLATLATLVPESSVNKFEYSAGWTYDTLNIFRIYNSYEFSQVNKEGVKTIRTAPLYLICEANDYLLLKKRNDYPICKINPLFRIKKSCVNNIISISEMQAYNQNLDSLMLGLKKRLDQLVREAQLRKNSIDSTAASKP